MSTDFEILRWHKERLQQSVTAACVEPFVCSLTTGKYPKSTIRGYVATLAHFAHWMTTEQIGLEQLDKALVERFAFEHVPRCQCAPPASCVVPNLRAAGRRLIWVGQRLGLVVQPTGHPSSAIADELSAFDDYLGSTRGLAIATRLPRRRIIADFLAWRFGVVAPDFQAITASDIHQFLISRLAACSSGKAAVFVGALRSYLRFRAFCGQPVDGALAAVPSVAQWPLDRLPCVLADSVIATIERSFDLATASGIRDYAMFHLMLDLGLRVSEVVGIDLEDIDWRAGTLRVADSKSHRIALLPLAPQVADAIIGYVTQARPPTCLRALFIRKRAPVDIPITLDAVRAAMRRAYVRCGHPQLCSRTHVLRHTAASRMLRAGAPLKQIADVLRHRCLDTTTIYAKVDMARLAAVAAPWPGSRP